MFAALGMLMRVMVLLVAAAAVLLSACAAPPRMVWLRTDGQLTWDDPVVTQQFQIDSTICLGEREKADLSGVTVTQGGFAGVVAAQNRAGAANAVARGCMAEKGYVQVREDEAPAKQQELAAIAVEKAKREAAAATPPSAPSAPSRRTVTAKPKSASPTPSPTPQPVSAPAQ
jgi:hypothetical protein